LKLLTKAALYKLTSCNE